MKIREFVEGYVNRIDKLKEQYINDNLKITKYIPFIQKDAIARVVVDRSTYRYETYKKEDGTIGSRKTNEIQVNSSVQYLLFCRVVIENYTDLEIETEEFFEEYDDLKQSGLLDKLMVGSENVPPIIPADEISELRMLIDMKQKDEIFNRTEIHNYISEQVGRFTDLLKVVSEPFIKELSNRLNELKESELIHLADVLSNVNFGNEE